jgi:hypothetical protein
VREGTRRDALRYALSANAEHGHRRTNEDKRRAVDIMLDDPEWSQLTDREIAEACLTGDRFVSSRRRQRPRGHYRTRRSARCHARMTPPPSIADARRARVLAAKAEERVLSPMRMPLNSIIGRAISSTRRNGLRRNAIPGGQGDGSPSVSLAARRLHRTCPPGQRPPAGDCPCALPRLLSIRNAGKQPPQLDGSRELATLLEDGTDRGGLSFGDDEHRWSMGRRLLGG